MLTPRSTHFPYTTLFRSRHGTAQRRPLAVQKQSAVRPAAITPRGWPRYRCATVPDRSRPGRSEEHTSELQSRGHLVCRLLLEKKKLYIYIFTVKLKILWI